MVKMFSSSLLVEVFEVSVLSVSVTGGQVTLVVKGQFPWVGEAGRTPVTREVVHREACTSWAEDYYLPA